MSEQDTTTDAGQQGESILEIENINTYYGTSHVLQDVSMSIPRGETTALIGRNGAGKTTTLRSVMGVTSPKSGRITFDGTEIQDKKPDKIRRMGISWVPEERRVFPSHTVAQNLKIANHASDENGQIEEMYDRFPRLDERRTQKAGTLSGGEKQMLAIARALIGPKSDLLLIDEPSEGLAPQIASDVFDILKELQQEGRSIVIVEQNAELALQLAEHAYVLKTGKVEFSGAADDLLEDEERLESLVGVA